MTFLLSWSLTTVIMAEALPLNKKLFDARLSGQRCALFIPRGEATGGGDSGRTGANSCWHSLVREHHSPEDEDAAMGEAAARGGRLHPEILRNTRRQRFPHSLLFRGLRGPDVHHATSPWHGGSPRFVDLGHNLWRSPFESACLKGTCDAAQLARVCHLREALEYDDVVRFHGPTIGQLHSWIPSHLMGTMDSTSLDAMFATG